MTNRNSKSRKSTVKATAAKDSVKRSSTAPAPATPLIVLGFDEQHKPRGARFVDAKPDLVIKAADLMGFKVYQASLRDVADVAKKLPLGRLYANGRGFVPNIRQSLYTDVVAELACEPQTLVSKNGDKDSVPAARGLPRSWDDIAAGHLMIAQESLKYGWWEAIVLDRTSDTFILQYRDYPHLPKFARHHTGVALMCSADNDQSWNEIASGRLVIAQESAKDGWWEAIVIDRKADTLTLQFRDYPTQPKIVRHRSAIALMYRANEARRPAADAQQADPAQSPAPENSLLPLIWRSVMDSKAARIRALNDELRQNFAQGMAVMTPGIAALGAEAVARIVKTVAVFDDFCHANDPHEEHDFGSFEADGHRVFFKIDYFDETLTYHSPDPADPSVTQRVITSCWLRSIEAWTGGIGLRAGNLYAAKPTEGSRTECERVTTRAWMRLPLPPARSPPPNRGGGRSRSRLQHQKRTVGIGKCRIGANHA